MRAVSFALEYAAGVDPVADAFRDHEELSSKSLAANVTADRWWRVDRFTGETSALDAATAAVEDYGHVDCLGDGDCGADRWTELLHRDPATRIVFAGWRRTEGCVSIPHLTLAHLGPGVLFATERRGSRSEWHVLAPTDANLGGLSEAIRDGCGEGVRFDLTQVTDGAAWLSAYGGRPALPYAHQETVRAALEHGYYETPRETTVEELAEELDLPRSTLSYRLRRAEAELARSLVGSRE